jgi:hypothetical protein
VRAPRGGWIGDPVKFNTNSHKTWLWKLEWLSSLKLVLVNTDNQIESTQETRNFIPWFGQVTLAYFDVVASQWTRVAHDPFQVIQWSTWIPRLYFLISFPVCEESPQVGASRPYNKDHNESTRVRLGSNTHKSAAHTRTQAKAWAQNEAQRVHN